MSPRSNDEMDYLLSRGKLGGSQKQRILDAALAAFYEHGYHGTTTRDLARRSGLSVPEIGRAHV